MMASIQPAKHHQANELARRCEATRREDARWLPKQDFHEVESPGSDARAARGRWMPDESTSVSEPSTARHRSSSTSLDIVIALHSSPIGVMLISIARSLPASVKPTAWVYNKGEALGNATKKVLLATMHEAGGSLQLAEGMSNVGRCDHTYLYHIVSRWSNLGDAVLFVKDTTFAHVHLGIGSKVLSFVRRLSSDSQLHFWCPRIIVPSPCFFEMSRYSSEQCKTPYHALLRGEVNMQRNCYQGELVLAMECTCCDAPRAILQARWLIFEHAFVRSGHGWLTMGLTCQGEWRISKRAHLASKHFLVFVSHDRCSL